MITAKTNGRKFSLEIVEPVPVGCGGAMVQCAAGSKQEASCTHTGHPTPVIDAALYDVDLPRFVVKHPAGVAPDCRDDEYVR